MRIGGGCSCGIWLLLALRCLLIAGLAAALARPTLKGTGLAARKAPRWRCRWSSIIRCGCSTCIRIARGWSRRPRRRGELVGKLPEDAAVAVCDLGRAASGFAPDLSAAASRLRNLRPTADGAAAGRRGRRGDSARPPSKKIAGRKCSSSPTSPRRRGPTDGLKAIDAALAEAPDVRIYVVDVRRRVAEERVAGRAGDSAQRAAAGRAAAYRSAGGEQLKGETPLVGAVAARRRGRLGSAASGSPSSTTSGQARVGVRGAPTCRWGRIRDRSADRRRSAGDRQHARTSPSRCGRRRRCCCWPSGPADARFVREALSPSLGDAVEPVRMRGRSRSPSCERSAARRISGGAAARSGAAARRRCGTRLWRIRLRRRRRRRLSRATTPSANCRRSTPRRPQRLLPGKLKRRLARTKPICGPRRLDSPGARGPAELRRGFPGRCARCFSFWQFDEASGRRVRRGGVTPTTSRRSSSAPPAAAGCSR